VDDGGWGDGGDDFEDDLTESLTPEEIEILNLKRNIETNCGRRTDVQKTLAMTETYLEKTAKQPERYQKDRIMMFNILTTCHIKLGQFSESISPLTDVMKCFSSSTTDMNFEGSNPDMIFNILKITHVHAVADKISAVERIFDTILDKISPSKENECMMWFKIQTRQLTLFLKLKAVDQANKKLLELRKHKEYQKNPYNLILSVFELEVAQMKKKI